MLFIFDIGSAQPSDFGNFYELYAIAAAVLGGCSLRGGEISVTGIVFGAATLQVLRNTIILVGLPSQLEFAVIGAVLLVGVAADELVRRLSARRLARRVAS
jgi:ribose transport system permease protein